MNEETTELFSIKSYKQKIQEDPRSPQELISQALAAPDRDDDAYWEAVEVLWYKASLETLHLAKDLCNSTDVVERTLGAHILGQLGGTDDYQQFHEERLSTLLHLLEHEQEPEVLAAICSSLGHLNDPRANEPVAKLKSHNDSDVRYAVVMGLLSQDDELSVSALIELTHDVDTHVRDWATFGIGSQIDLDTPAIREALAERLTDLDKDARCEALVGLAARKDKRVIEPLIQELRSKSVGSLVLEAATLIADNRLCPALLELRADIGEDKETDEALAACGCESLLNTDKSGGTL